MLHRTLLAFTVFCLLSTSVLGQEKKDVSGGYIEVAEAINTTLRKYHYDPAELESDAYRRMEVKLIDLAQVATTDDALLEGFADLWSAGPFSHVALQRARASAEDTAAYLDDLRIGGGGAVLTWQDDCAVLTVTTMMGVDTIEEIEAAFDLLAQRGARALIIDLRDNPGGAFAVRPLVGHVLSRPLDAGVFLSHRWNQRMQRAPTIADVRDAAPWEGWSIRTFWAEARTSLLLRVRFRPLSPRYSGPVFVLTSQRTTSAAELAADAFKASGRGTLVGETTAGRMLSQALFDIPGGFLLSLPIADYHSFETGRIEGNGVTPHILVPETDALDIATKLARQRDWRP